MLSIFKLFKVTLRKIGGSTQRCCTNFGRLFLLGQVQKRGTQQMFVTIHWSTLLSHILVLPISFLLLSFSLVSIEVTSLAKSVKIGVIGVILWFENHLRDLGLVVVFLNKFILFLNLLVDLTNFIVQMFESFLQIAIFQRRSLKNVGFVPRNLVKLLKSLFDGFCCIQSTHSWVWQGSGFGVVARDLEMLWFGVFSVFHYKLFLRGFN